MIDVCVCVCLCVCVCVYMYTYIHTYSHTNIYIYGYTYRGDRPHDTCGAIHRIQNVCLGCSYCVLLMCS